jgi:tetratricopeptide (TPR) repeat protein
MNGPIRLAALALAVALATGCASQRPTPPVAPPTAAAPPPVPAAPPTPSPALGTVVIPTVPPPAPPPPVTPPPVAATPTAAADAARARLDYGRALLARGDAAAAAVAFREALRLQPDLAEARATLGLALYALGDLDAAVEELRGLLRVRPDLSEARLTLAAALVARQDWPGARAELEKALAAQPDLVQAHYTLGVVRYAQGDLTGAIDAYRRVLAREPRAADARYNLALVLKLARRDAEATPEFLAAAEAGLPRAQYFAGAAYATGAGVGRDLVAAITWWTRAAEQGVTQAEESLAQLRQTASGHARRPPGERQAVEQAFAEYRARLWQDYPGLAREGDEPLGVALLRQGRAQDAVPVLIREAAALSEPALRALENLYEQGVEGQVPAHDARILASLRAAAAEGRTRPRP